MDVSAPSESRTRQGPPLPSASQEASPEAPLPPPVTGAPFPATAAGVTSPAAGEGQGTAALEHAAASGLAAGSALGVSAAVSAAGSAAWALPAGKMDSGAGLVMLVLMAVPTVLGKGARPPRGGVRAVGQCEPTCQATANGARV